MMSTSPASAIARATDASSATSITTARPPTSAATTSISAAVRAATHTAAPSSASTRATAAPMPRPPPVTSARRPSSRPMSGILPGRGWMTNMQIGFGIPVSGSWATPANVVEISRRAEELGYASLWSFQRTVYPADNSIPAPYRSVHDPLAVSGYVAAVTERVRNGIAIVNLPFYAPIMLAKTLTSIDVLSEGRLDAGLGLGWNRDEFDAAGVPMERRGARAEDFIQCLRAIWTQDPVEHHGEFYAVPRGHVDPKPVQRPHPPILLGGSAEPALKRAGRLAEGWISASRFEAAKVPPAV